MNALHWSATVGGVPVRVTVALLDGYPSHLSAQLGKAGADVRAALELVCEAVSLGLKSGVPLENYSRTLEARSFPPNGPTDDPAVPTCSSVVDYIAKSTRLRLAALAPQETPE